MTGHCRLSLILAVCSVAAIASAAPELKDAKVPPRAAVSIEAIDATGLRLYDTVSFNVRLSAINAAENIDISSVAASALGSTANIYASKTDSCRLHTSSIEASESAIIATCTLYVAKSRIDPSLIIRPTIDALISVVVTPSGEQSNPLQVIAPIALMPPWYAPFLGGLIGALSLACVAGLWKVRTSERLSKARAALSDSALTSQSLRIALVEITSLIFDLFLYLLSEWGFATITAFVFIVLGQGTTVAGAPVQISVTDFWGGIVIGLFAFPLNRWLLERLGVTPAKTHPA